MAFGFGKLAVLESKLDIYEDLSKEMLDKLERAVGTISENSNKIAVILERHRTKKILTKLFITRTVSTHHRILVRALGKLYGNHH